MKLYRCDKCGKEIIDGKPLVKVRGITGDAGGILLPERFHKKHFCDPDCFWQWVEKVKPSLCGKRKC